MLNILKHRELSRRIAELTEELEELRSEKKQLLAMMDYAEDTGLSTVKKDISAMETNLIVVDIYLVLVCGRRLHILQILLRNMRS